MHSSRRAGFRGKLPVALEIEIALHVADGKMKPICRPVAATFDWDNRRDRRRRCRTLVDSILVVS